MSILELYLLTILPSIGHSFGGFAFMFAVISMIAIGIVIIAHFAVNDHGLGESNIATTKAVAKGFRKWIPLPVTIFFVSFLISTFSPTEKQMAIIVGGYMLTNIEGVKDLPPNIVKAMNTALEHFAEKAKETNEKK